MRRERQIELLERVAAAGRRLEGLYGPESMVNQASAYTDRDRFAIEQRVLFREGPVFFGLSADVRQPGSWRAMRFDGIPIVVVRQADGLLRALVNICRHRAAPLVDPNGRGGGLAAFSCPYHAWTYELDGRLRTRPAAQRAFDDVTAGCDLLVAPVAERYGLIFVRPTGDAPIDVDDALGGAQDDLEAFGLGDYVLIESRTSEWDMNWKLVFDTFTESYHIRTLHRNTLAATFNSEATIFEPFGRNLLTVGLRANVGEELAKPRDEWSLLHLGTIQYFLVPTGLVVHQLDHLEVWNVEPLGVGRSRLTASIYAPGEPHSERSRNYFVKNLDLLLQVTGTEDFPMMEEIQRNLASGALEQVVYGKIEPPLAHFHREVNKAIEASTLSAPSAEASSLSALRPRPHRAAEAT
jgi:phenylpropionate dioxygenase-like ring-hydroxylating dioxygenase large terminal subunit